MHAISSYPGNRPTHKQTDRTDFNTLPQLERTVTRKALSKVYTSAKSEESALLTVQQTQVKTCQV